MFTFRLISALLCTLLGFVATAAATPIEDLLSPGQARGSTPLGLTASGISNLFGELDGGGPFYDETGRLLGKRGFYRVPEEGMGHDVGDLPGGMSETVAHGSNAAGQIVGRSAVEGGTHAFVWQEGVGMTDLGDLPGGAVEGAAHDINADGIVVGTGTTADGLHAFLWKPASGMWDLNELIEADTGLVLREALAIDSAGRVAGRAEDDTGDRAFLWDPATGLLDLSDPVAVATLDGVRQDMFALRFAEIRALGAGGHAVGRALSKDGRDRPVLWTGEAALRDLGDLSGGTGSGTAHGINAASQIVGHAVTSDGARAFLWEPESGIVDLNSMILPYDDVVLHRAVDIDDLGRILAYGRKGAAIHYFLMTPEAVDIDDTVEAMVEEDAGFEKGSGAAGYALTDLGEFLLRDDGPAALAMDETGRIVGGCDLLTTACPYLSDNPDLITSFLDDSITNFFDDTEPMPETGIVPSPGPGPVPGPTPPPGVGPVGSPGSEPTGGGPPPLPPIGGTFGGGGDEDGPGTPSGSDTPEPRPDGPGSPPEIPIAAVPLPSAVGGLLLALGLLGGFGRRRAA